MKPAKRPESRDVDRGQSPSSEEPNPFDLVDMDLIEAMPDGMGWTLSDNRFSNS